MIHKFLKRWRRGYYRLCVHRSHRLRLPCYRFQTYDHQCAKHNTTCFNGCRYAKPEALDIDGAVLYDEVHHWLETYGEHRLTAWQDDLLRRFYDPQQDYPPPLRRPTGDRSYPPMRPGDSSQVSDSHPTTPTPPQEAE